MNQGGHGGWSLHGIGHPNVQTQLRRFPHRAHKQQQGHKIINGQRIARKTHNLPRDRGQGGKQCIKLHRAKMQVNRKNPQRQPQIPHTVDHKGLHGRRVGRWFFMPKPNQQIGCQTDAFPSKKQLHQIIRRHQHHHAKHKQV